MILIVAFVSGFNNMILFNHHGHIEAYISNLEELAYVLYTCKNLIVTVHDAVGESDKDNSVAKLMIYLSQHCHHQFRYLPLKRCVLKKCI